MSSGLSLHVETRTGRTGAGTRRRPPAALSRVKGCSLDGRGQGRRTPDAFGPARRRGEGRGLLSTSVLTDDLDSGRLGLEAEIL
jgi:hypothetical protein